MTKLILAIIIIIVILSLVLPILIILLINRKHKVRLWIKIVVPVSIFLLVNTGGPLIYFSIHYQATSEVKDYLVDDSEVKVTNTGNYYLFDNVSNNETSIVFYGGAKVEEKSYAPMLNKLAHQGVDVFLVKMPFCFPLFGIGKADDIYKDNNTYSNVYLMGHSLGGVCASKCLSATKYEYKGIIFLASYPDKKLDDKYKALSIYGTNDTVLNKKEYDKHTPCLPTGYSFKTIEGGNHANYGYYGNQKGDSKANITREQQIDITINYVMDLLNS